MIRFFHRQPLMSLILLMCASVSIPLRAQVSNSPPTAAPAVTTAPVLRSPVVFFRELLAMTPAQREQPLAQWPPEKRARLLAKIKEYENMTPQTREESLAATELHWYLQQFLPDSSTNHDVQLSQVPEPYRKMVSDRLTLWQILPPPIRLEVLAHETTRDFFLLGKRADIGTNVPLAIIPPPLRQELVRLDVLPPQERQQTYSHFQSFFELNATEKQAVLDTLPATERQRLEKTIQALDHLPREKREQALKSLGELAGLTDEQRREFLINMGRWKQLSPDEQQLWLKLATLLPPMPPLPPPIPPRPPTLPALSIATNPSH
jgi:hypothetical protein